MRVALRFFASLAVAWSTAHAASPTPAFRTEFGTHDGASFRIDTPAAWNGGLVMYYHGYSVDPVTFRDGEPPSPMFLPLLARGFAVAQSGYAQAGWSIEQAFDDTEWLRRHAVEKLGRAKETYVFGMSMGGALTAMTIERMPAVYDGALSLCGAIEPSDRLLRRSFALRAAFDYYFPNLLGALVPVPDDYAPNGASEQRIRAALDSKPEAAASLLAFYGVADRDSIASVIGFDTYIIGELQHRAHGNPFGNADLVYTGPADTDALNAGVKRYAADPGAVAYLAKFYTPTGKLARPFLAVHDTRDPLVPASAAFEYALLAERNGNGRWFAQQFVGREGHCVFEPEEIGRAFDELVAWKRSGAKPKSGALPKASN